MARQHTLFLACTRPALIMGIPIEAFVVAGLFCTETFMISGMMTKSLWRIAWLFGSLAVCYLICRVLIAIDHNIFHILKIWGQTKCRTSRNAAFWGGSSTSPAPLKRPRKREEIPCLV
jgi:type IV secretion system protein VirB3